MLIRHREREGERWCGEGAQIASDHDHVTTNDTGPMVSCGEGNREELDPCLISYLAAGEFFFSPFFSFGGDLSWYRQRAVRGRGEEEKGSEREREEASER